MENQKLTSDEAVIQYLAVEKTNLEIQLARTRHLLAEVTAERDELKQAQA